MKTLNKNFLDIVSFKIKFKDFSFSIFCLYMYKKNISLFIYKNKNGRKRQTPFIINSVNKKHRRTGNPLYLIDQRKISKGF